jgi:hypothetical protein
LLSIEEVLEHLLDLWDTSGTSNEDDFVNLTLAAVSILEYVLNGWHTFAEMWKTKFFELGTRNVDIEVFTFSKSLTVDFRLMGC